MDDKNDKKLKILKRIRNINIGALGLETVLSGACLYSSFQGDPLAPVGFGTGAALGVLEYSLVNNAENKLDQIKKLEDCSDQEIRNMKIIQNLKLGASIALLVGSNIVVHQMFSDIPLVPSSFMCGTILAYGTTSFATDTVNSIKKIKEYKKDLNKKD